MTQEITPIFKTHYSQRSILTLEKKGKSNSTGADSIIDIAVEAGLKDVFLAEDGMSSFLEAYTNCKDAGLNLHYGLRVTVTQDIAVKDDASRKTDSKVIVFARNGAGYGRLIKIATKAATDGFYYEPRIDSPSLKSLWSDADLLYCLPFYDSFIYYNTLTFRSIVPELFTNPLLFTESNDLVFDDVLADAVNTFSQTTGFEKVPVQTIYYKNNADIKTFQTYKCIQNRSTLAKPQLDHFHSDRFSFQEWKRKSSAA